MDQSGIGGLISIAGQIGGDVIGDAVADLLEQLPRDRMTREGWISVV